MASNQQKIKAFEYLIQQLIVWFKESKPGVDYSTDFTKLKLTKLLFFTTAVNTSERNQGLLEVFDNYWALPFGHVESDVYNNLDITAYFDITKNGLTTKGELPANYFNEINEYIPLLEESLNCLKKENFELIQYTAFDLVELSHSWQSWQSIFNLARSHNKSSMKIPNSLIQAEPKFFSLVTES